MKKNKSVFGYLFLSGILVGFFMYLYLVNQRGSVVLSVETPPQQFQVPPTPSPLAQISPDGTHMLSLKTKGDLTELYVNDEVISTRTMEPGTVLSIPFNTWSPDNKYFFLKATKPDNTEYLVMTRSGKPFAGDILYFMIRDLFATAHPESEIVEVTGWAAPTLLIINAKSGTEAKMSFWFDVQTQKFIRLSNYFY